MCAPRTGCSSRASRRSPSSRAKERWPSSAPALSASTSSPPGGSPRNVIDVTITELEPHGDQIRVRTSDLSADVTSAAVADLDLVPHTPAVFAVKASEVAIYRA